MHWKWQIGWGKMKRVISVFIRVRANLFREITTEGLYANAVDPAGVRETSSGTFGIKYGKG